MFPAGRRPRPPRTRPAGDFHFFYGVVRIVALRAESARRRGKEQLVPGFASRHLDPRSLSPHSGPFDFGVKRRHTS